MGKQFDKPGVWLAVLVIGTAGLAACAGEPVANPGVPTETTKPTSTSVARAAPRGG